MPSPAAILNIVITANATAAQANIAKTEAQMKSLAATSNSSAMATAGAWQKAGQRMSSIGRTMTRTISLPAAAIGAASVKAAYDFDKSMMRIQHLAGTSAMTMKQFREEVLKLAPAVGKSPTELANALYFIRSSGIKAADSMEVLAVTAKASAIGLGETETVADAVTSAMNAYRRSNLTAAQATEILAKTVKLGKGEPAELAKSIGRVIPVASKLKVPFSDVGASLAGLTLQGLDAAEATTALRAVFLAVLKPGTQAKDMLASVGLSSEQLRKVLEQKGTLAMLGLLAERFKGNEEAMARVFPNVRGLVGAFNLQGDSMKRNIQIQQEMSKQTDLVGRQFADYTKSDVYKFNSALADLQVTAIKLGSSLLPIVVKIAKAFAGLAKVLTAIPGAAELLIGAIILGPMIRMIGLVVQATAAWKAYRLAALGAAGANAAAGASGAAALGGAGGMFGIGGAAARAGGAGAGAGLAAGLLKYAKGAGVVAAGVAVGDVLADAIGTTLRKRSDNIWTALEAKGHRPDVLGISGSDIGLGFLDQSLLQMVGLVENNRDKANELKGMLEQVAKTHIVTPEQVKQIWSLADALDLTANQAKKVADIVGPAAAPWRGMRAGLDWAKQFFNLESLRSIMQTYGTTWKGGMKRLAENAITYLGTLPPAARESAAKTMIGMASILTAQGKMPLKTLKILIDQLKAQFPGLQVTAKNTSHQVAATFNTQLGKISTEAPQRKFDKLVQKVRWAMNQGIITVKEGQQTINSILAKEYAALGFSFPKQVIEAFGAQGHTRRTQQQQGGLLPGPSRGDKIPLLAEGGEYMVNARATKRFLPYLEAMNKSVPRFQGGGKIPSFQGVAPGMMDDISARALNRMAEAGRKNLAKKRASMGGRGGMGGGSATWRAIDALASQWGLHISSGFRPGSITSSGNLSFHAQRGPGGRSRATDYADSPHAMLVFARKMSKRYGHNLAELIHTPLGYSIKNGARTAPIAASDHYSHVHVAMQKGGIIKGKTSVFGPPLEAAGTTASGVSSSRPGIAIYDRSTLGKMFKVTVAGHTARLRQTDIGPAPWTGRKIDITGAGVRALGMNPHNFPTDALGKARLVSTLPQGGNADVAGGLKNAKPKATQPGLLGGLKGAIDREALLEAMKAAVEIENTRRGNINELRAAQNLLALQRYQTGAAQNPLLGIPSPAMPVLAEMLGMQPEAFLYAQRTAPVRSGKAKKGYGFGAGIVGQAQPPPVHVHVHARKGAPDFTSWLDVQIEKKQKKAARLGRRRLPSAGAR